MKLISSILVLLLLILSVVHAQYYSFVSVYGTALTMPKTLAQGYIRAVLHDPTDKAQQWQLVSVPSLGTGHFVVSRVNPNYVIDVANNAAYEGVRLVSYTRKTTAASSANQRFIFNNTALISVMNSNKYAIGVKWEGLVQLDHHTNRRIQLYPVAVLPEVFITFQSTIFDINVSIPYPPPSEAVTSFIVPANSNPVVRSFIPGTRLIAHDTSGNLLPPPYRVSVNATVAFTAPQPTATPTDLPLTGTCVYVFNPFTGYYWAIRDLPYITFDAIGTTFYLHPCGAMNCASDFGYSAACSGLNADLGKIDNADITVLSANSIRFNAYGGYNNAWSTITYTCERELISPKAELYEIRGSNWKFDVSIPLEYCTYWE